MRIASFGYSESYVSTLFKKEVGVSLKHCIIDKKLKTSRELLIGSDFSILEISDIFAFSSSSHFIHLFKEKYGVTPQEFRRRNYR